jgi:hypothetical protein
MLLELPRCDWELEGIVDEIGVVPFEIKLPSSKGPHAVS